MTYHDTRVESFSKEWVTLESVEGHPYMTWEWCRMPRISDEYVNCAVYLYPTVAMAKGGETFGGSGFILKMMTRFDPSKRHYYVVTNSHVIQQGHTVIRINRKDGSVATIPTEQSLWAHSEKADLAVFPIALNDSYNIWSVNDQRFLTKFKKGTKGCGVGDDTFIVGRFINHEGKQKNRPTVRFGTIAMMPDPEEGIYNNNMSQHQESYLVETHTICGYSGSPVFFYIPAFSKRPKEDAAKNPLAWRGPWLLGVDWGHIINHEPVLKPGKSGALEKTDMVAEVTTGMMCVTPAWYLGELLKEPHLMEEREKIEKQWEKDETPKSVARLDSATTPMRGDDILRAALNTAPVPQKKPKAKRSKRGRAGVSSK